MSALTEEDVKSMHEAGRAAARPVPRWVPISIFVALCSCTSPEDAEANSRKLMESLGITTDRVNCADNALLIHRDFSYECTLRTKSDQVYTTVCLWNECNVVRGPGQ